MPSQQRNVLIILILGSLATVSPFSIDMYLPSFALIAADFGTTTARVSLSVSSYFIGLAIGQLLYGPLLDRFGRKLPLFGGLMLFIVASVACMQSTSIEALIVFRFVQAIGGCAASVASMAMVRDFFPVEQSARIFSLLVLILGVSPLLAPTLGGFITAYAGWKWIFITLALIVGAILLAAMTGLPPGRKPDQTVSLRAGPILATFFRIVLVPQFYVYTLSGAFAFASLFIYVAGSPVIFMERFAVAPQIYGGIFAVLSVGFIGSNQLNILALRYFKSAQVFAAGVIAQLVIAVVFLSLGAMDLLGLYTTIGMFFLSLCSIGFIAPNANALALAPFARNAGSASALIGCIQIGVAALASACIGLFNSSDIVPVTAVMACTSTVAALILYWGKMKVTALAEPDGLSETGIG